MVWNVGQPMKAHLAPACLTLTMTLTCFRGLFTKWDVQEKGCVSAIEVEKQTEWTSGRVMDALQSLLKVGWGVVSHVGRIKGHKVTKCHAYWFSGWVATFIFVLVCEKSVGNSRLRFCWNEGRQGTNTNVGSSSFHRQPQVAISWRFLEMGVVWNTDPTRDAIGYVF